MHHTTPSDPWYPMSRSVWEAKKKALKQRMKRWESKQTEFDIDQFVTKLPTESHGPFIEEAAHEEKRPEKEGRNLKRTRELDLIIEEQKKKRAKIQETFQQINHHIKKVANLLDDVATALPNINERERISHLVDDLEITFADEIAKIQSPFFS
jgi:DNA repair exonuclease SbcCD ATPase subunit